MDYALKLNQFDELNYEEMQIVDGGWDIQSIIGQIASALYAGCDMFVAMAPSMGPWAVVPALVTYIVNLFWG